MRTALAKPSELFSDAATPADLAKSWDTFQQAMVDAPSTAKGDVAYAPTDGGGHVLTKTQSVGALAGAQGLFAEGGDLAKALSTDQLASVQKALEGVDVQKDFTLTNPLATGYVAYDLEAPAKLLYPKPTPLRNKLPRTKGVGIAHQFKTIDGVSGTVGGPAPVRPGISDTSTAQFGPLTLNRGAKIAYAGHDVSVPYIQFGLSDSVPFSAQFAGAGFMDARATSRASLLYASMLSEERLLLGGRGTASAFQGALAAPSGITLNSRAAAASEVGLSGGNTTVWVKVTAKSIFGESVLSGVASVAYTAGNVIDVIVGSEPVGALGYNVYVSTGSADPGDTGRFFMATGGSATTTLQGAIPAAGRAASLVVADTSASALEYDGILTVCGGTASGYRKRLNSTFSTSNPGVEFQTAFASMYQANLADPDEVLLNGFDRKQLSDLLKTASSANYRIQIQQGTEGQSLGNLVTGLVNEVTGSMVDLTVHPYLPQGNAPILSHTLPFADSNVGELWTARNVQDYMAIDWPVIQHSYDAGVYWFGTFFCYAPAWQGIVQGIKLA